MLLTLEESKKAVKAVSVGTLLAYSSSVLL